MRLVFDLPRKDGLPVPGFHMHAIEGRGVPLAELASHNYAVRSPCFLLAHHIPPWLSYRRYTLPFYGPKYAKPSRIFVPTATPRVMLGPPRSTVTRGRGPPSPASYGFLCKHKIVRPTPLSGQDTRGA